MKIKYFLLLNFLIYACSSNPEETTLPSSSDDNEDFMRTAPVIVCEGTGKKGMNPYYNTRIPAAEVAKDGSLILLWQGRYDGADRGIDHLLISKSTDNGETWKQIPLFEGNNTDLGDNSLIFDKVSGRLWAMAYVSGKSSQLIYYSDDNGNTWSKHEQLIKNEKGEFLRMRGTTGITISGNNKSFMILPAITGSGKLAYMYCMCGEKDWKFLGEHNIIEYNEPTCVQLKSKDNNYAYIMNVSRTKESQEYKRKSLAKINLSTLNIEWEPLETTNDFFFKQTTCNQHMKRYSDIHAEGDTILYASTINGSGHNPSRYGGMVAYSTDEGKTWSSKEIVNTDTHFSYCSQVKLKDGSIGLFYETHNRKGTPVRYGSIKFIRYSLKWLTNSKS